MMTEVKEYLSHHHIPQLLESLLTGLLYHHPEDPVGFLQSCLIKTRQLGGPEAVTWDAFIPVWQCQRLFTLSLLPAPQPGPLSSPVRSQLSIDSDSDLTESSGLRQEVSIIRPQKPLIIFIIGGPGSGKGSQAARLARCFSFRVISLDELLRRQLLSHASPSRKWKAISEMMGHGELGPQEETISELRRQLIDRQEVRGFIVEGFPRDVHQALCFQEQIGSPDVVMLLLCSNETLRCRLQRRAAQLDLLGDNSHALRRRLEAFQRDAVSVRRYYRQLHLLTQVDGDADEDVIFADLSSVIREKLKDSGPADIPECSNAVRSVNQ
ncbi:Adenylate kinase isoenzyme 5 [Nibea albiflora]|nr:Adenylate kinase isoenzyme 5 [Nibea albiflora]